MRRIVSAAAALLVGATAVYAQNLGVIKERKQLFNSMADAAKVPAAMSKKEVPFDLARVQIALKALHVTVPRLKGMFPADSRSGGKTLALPVIWDKMPDFTGRFDKFANEIKAAQAAIKDEASFKAEWPKIMGNCVGCHKLYQKPE